MSGMYPPGPIPSPLDALIFGDWALMPLPTLVKVVITPDRAILMGRTGIAFLGPIKHDETALFF